jgi:integron integrase
VPEPKLLDQVRQTARLKHFSLRTERAYAQWVYRFVVYHGKRHPRELGAPEVQAFLTWLAVERDVSASTQNQALCALLFLYREVLRIDLPRIEEAVRARRSRRVPTVLTRDEVRAVMAHLDGVHALVAGLLYGGGLRLLEALRLRVKDIDFERRSVVVRQGKGDKDRTTMLPERLREPLMAHLEKVRALHRRDLADGFGAVALPHALARKKPGAEKEWGWQYVFPSGPAVHRPALGPPRAAPPLRIVHPEGGGERRPPVGHREAGRVPHAAPLVRHAPAGGRLRYPHRAGAAGPRGRAHHHDLHPRAEPRWPRRAQPTRPRVSRVPAPRVPPSCPGALPAAAPAPPGRSCHARQRPLGCFGLETETAAVVPSSRP